jgi:hypothetical protein
MVARLTGLLAVTLFAAIATRPSHARPQAALVAAKRSSSIVTMRS